MPAKWKKNLTKTSAQNVYRIELVNSLTGARSTPPKKFEARREMIIEGKRKKNSKCFEDFTAARAFSKLAIEVVERPAEVVREVTTNPLVPQYFWQLFDRYVKNELSLASLSSQKTYLSRKRHLKYFMRRSVKMSMITPEFIDRWFARIRDRRYVALQHSTRLTYREEMKLLKRVLEYMVESYNTDFAMPLRKRHQKLIVLRPRPPKEKKDLLAVDYNRLVGELGARTRKARVRINSATDDRSRAYFTDLWEIGRRVHVVARLQGPLGGRIQEIPAIRYEDMNSDRKEVTLSRRVVWKREAGGDIAVEEGLKATDWKVIPSAHACSIITEWALQEGIRSGPLFFYKGQPISYRQIQYRYDEAFAALGLAKSGTHLVRHGMANEARKIGGMRAAQGLLGHKNERTTETYVGIREDEFRESMSKMDDLLSAATQ